MEWETLLSTEKLGDEEKEPKKFGEHPINEFEKDYNKIVSSSAFRRLQDKTQVFPLDKSDFVRTRLTHSIEVSTIAKQLGIMIFKNTNPYRQIDIEPENAEKIPSILLCAGLLHDLGNPPFGHFGEVVIGDWFKENLCKIEYKDKGFIQSYLTPQMVADLENFEGNAQALRILLKSKHNSEINLSKSVISTLVKYPVNSESFDKDNIDIKKHKWGFFFSEQEEFQNISKDIGTIKEDGVICRHPLTYILEAADDIAYATADLEDAFKKKLFTIDEFIEFFKGSYDIEDTKEFHSPAYYSEILIKNLVERKKESSTYEEDSRNFKAWLNYTRRWLMYVAAYSFFTNYDEIMSGSYSYDLFYNNNHSLTIKILKNAMGKFVFDTPDILKLELSAQSILSFLLKNFVQAVLYYDDYMEGEFKPSKADRKYLSILSENYKQDYINAKKENPNIDEKTALYLRLLMAGDYISGMTDSFARTLYRELRGIE